MLKTTYAFALLMLSLCLIAQSPYLEDEELTYFSEYSLATLKNKTATVRIKSKITEYDEKTDYPVDSVVFFFKKIEDETYRPVRLPVDSFGSNPKYYFIDWDGFLYGSGKYLFKSIAYYSTYDVPGYNLPIKKYYNHVDDTTSYNLTKAQCQMVNPSQLSVVADKKGKAKLSWLHTKYKTDYLFFEEYKIYRDDSLIYTTNKKEFTDQATEYDREYSYSVSAVYKNYDNDIRTETQKSRNARFKSKWSPPVVTDLMQNYPNPFNPTTMITFVLAKPDRVSLAIYNASGQLVNKLLESELLAGVHNYEFNAVALPSGLYFYKLSTSETSKIMKMMLLK